MYYSINGIGNCPGTSSWSESQLAVLPLALAPAEVASLRQSEALSPRRRCWETPCVNLRFRFPSIRARHVEAAASDGPMEGLPLRLEKCSGTFPQPSHRTLEIAPATSRLHDSHSRLENADAVDATLKDQATATPSLILSPPESPRFPQLPQALLLRRGLETKTELSRQPPA